MDTVRPDKSNTCAIIVTFHPDRELASRVRRISNQVSMTALVSNDGDQSLHARLDSAFKAADEEASQIIVIVNPRNLGVAAALNQGVVWARARDFQWMLLLDQDTIINDDCVAEQGKIFDDYPEPERIGIIGANSVGTVTCIPSPQSSSRSWQAVPHVITSGSLVKNAVVTDVGLFREDYFIDLVDVEYCLRIQKSGYVVLRSTRPLMTHPIGAPTAFYLAGRFRTTSNHRPERRYFMARNTVAVFREYFFVRPWVVLKLLKSLLAGTVVLTLYETERVSKLRMISLGIWDGVCGSFKARVQCQG